MPSTDALIDGIVATLKADAGVSAIVRARVYPKRPLRPTVPYLTCANVSTFPERQDKFDRDVLTVEIQAWASRRPHRKDVRPLVDAVQRALDQADFALAGPYGLGRIELVSAEMPHDDVAGTNFGVLRFECEVTQQA